MDFAVTGTDRAVLRVRSQGRAVLPTATGRAVTGAATSGLATLLASLATVRGARRHRRPAVAGVGQPGAPGGRRPTARRRRARRVRRAVWRDHHGHRGLHGLRRRLAHRARPGPARHPLRPAGLAAAAVAFPARPSPSWSAGSAASSTPVSRSSSPAATAVFLVEDALRRLLMAGLRFWRIVAVDLASLCRLHRHAAGVVALAGGDRARHRSCSACSIGQSVAIVVAVALLPATDRWLAPLARGRSAPSPATAPGGPRSSSSAPACSPRSGCWWSPSRGWPPWARSRRPGSTRPRCCWWSAGPARSCSPPTRPRRPSSRGAAQASRPRRARAVRRDHCHVGGGRGWRWACRAAADLRRLDLLTVTAVIGWCAYAVSVAAVTPYGALAAVQRRQAAVLGLRTADSVLSLSAVAVLLLTGRRAGLGSAGARRLLAGRRHRHPSAVAGQQGGARPPALIGGHGIFSPLGCRATDLLSAVSFADQLHVPNIRFDLR